MSHPPKPIDGHLFGADQPCFGCGPSHPSGFHLTFEHEGDEIVTRFTPTDRYQGPPGIMHGGLVSTLADEVAAWAVIAKLGKFGFTASFEARFRQPVRIGVTTEARARIANETSRLVEVDVRIMQNAHDAFTGKFKFVLVDQTAAERVLQGPLPEAWKQFCK